MIVRKKTSLPLTVKADTHISRRQFLQTSAGLGLSAAGMALLSACGISPTQPGAQEAVLETTTIRLDNTPTICLAPLFMAEDLLKDEGFTDVQYVDWGKGTDFYLTPPWPLLLNPDPASTILAGLDTGCFELYVNDQVKQYSDLKGKTMAVTTIKEWDHAYISMLIEYAGIDPSQDVHWMEADPVKHPQLLTDGRVDAILIAAPETQVLRSKKFGHTLVNSMMDLPWSQYFCSMLTALNGFERKNPVATKRVVRAVLKATDICATQPERTAQVMLDRGIMPNYTYALEAAKMIPYHWREYEPDDTLRFYALRMREAGMVEATPDELIKDAADWHFLDDLKLELKA